MVKAHTHGNQMERPYRSMHVQLLGVIFLMAVTTVDTDGSRNVSPVIKTSSPKDKKQGIQYPMLYFSADRIDELRNSARTTHRHITEALKRSRDRVMNVSHSLMVPAKFEEFAKHWNEIYGNNLPLLALYYLLHPTDKDLHDFILTYMDRMVSFPAWITASAPRDEVPTGHSLAGFATAYDFMWPFLDIKRRQLYVQKIVNVTKSMFELSAKRWWGKSYLQNHVATNVVSTFMGALVAEQYFSAAAAWKRHSLVLYERTIKLLEYIKDGSLNEGVGYGGYTFRSMSQYMFLVKRHLDVDHYGLPWLREHFDFYYYTVLPGMKFTVGIADSSLDWFYGPESQLVFLDTFVLRNGSGNWLAQEIRKHKNVSHNGHLDSTLHTEFIWFDPTLVPIPPLKHGNAESKLFDDWGVFIYQSPTLVDADTRSFLSFKSSYIHGKAVYHMANKLNGSEVPSFVNGWRSFNPGHEHPDQNSFTYAPRGNMFITEGYYSIKYSHLNNILTFSPSNVSGCTAPVAGQLGDCSKWFGWKTSEESLSHGNIKGHGTANNIVFVTGEAVGAYHSTLRLQSVERTLLLLDDDILVVTDYILTKRNSKLRFTNAYFNNVFHNFTFTKFSSGLNGAQINPRTGSVMNIFWTTMRGESPKPQVSYIDYKSGRTPNKISNLNITFEMAKPGEYTKLVFVLVGPDTFMTSFKVKEHEADVDAITLATTDQREYSIVISRSANETGPQILIHERDTDLITWFPVTSKRDRIDQAEKELYDMFNIKPNASCFSKATVALFCFFQLICVTIVYNTRRKSKKLFSGIIAISIITVLIYSTRPDCS